MSLELYRTVAPPVVGDVVRVEVGSNSGLSFDYILDGDRIVKGLAPLVGTLKVDLGDLGRSSGHLSIDLRGVRSQGPGHTGRIQRALREAQAPIGEALSFVLLKSDLGSAPSVVGASFVGTVELSVQLPGRSVEFPMRVRVDRVAVNQLLVRQLETPSADLRHLWSGDEIEALMSSLSSFELVPEVGIQFRLLLDWTP